MTDLIADLNLPGAIDRQNNKCLQCGKFINDKGTTVYFRMDQAINMYDVYCHTCGLDWDKKDREAGINEIND